MARITHLAGRLAGSSRERLAERLSAAAYGTVLVLVSLGVLDAEDVSSGLGWEIVTGVGAATWLAHLYAEVVGDRVRSGAALDRKEIGRAMFDGLPILLAAIPPAVVLGLGRLDVLDHDVALWAAVAIALGQLIGVGLFVGFSVSAPGVSVWPYAVVTAVIGIGVVTLKLALGH
jgi:hypothetical protein